MNGKRNYRFSVWNVEAHLPYGLLKIEEVKADPMLSAVFSTKYESMKWIESHEAGARTKVRLEGSDGVYLCKFPMRKEKVCCIESTTSSSSISAERFPVILSNGSDSSDTDHTEEVEDLTDEKDKIHMGVESKLDRKTWREIVANGIYRLLSGGWFETTRSSVKYVNVEKIVKKRRKKMGDVLTMITEFVSDYHDIGKLNTIDDHFDKEGRECKINFMKYVKKYHRPPETVLHPDTNDRVYVVGLMALFSAAILLGDVDVLGKSGRNIGCFFTKTSQTGRYYRCVVVQIDGECALGVKGSSIHVSMNDGGEDLDFRYCTSRTSEGRFIKYSQLLPAQKAEFDEAMYYQYRVLCHSKDVFFHVGWREGKFNEISQKYKGYNMISKKHVRITIAQAMRRAKESYTRYFSNEKLKEFMKRQSRADRLRNWGQIELDKAANFSRAVFFYQQLYELCHDKEYGEYHQEHKLAVSICLVTTYLRMNKPNLAEKYAEEVRVQLQNLSAKDRKQKREEVLRYINTAGGVLMEKNEHKDAIALFLKNLELVNSKDLTTTCHPTFLAIMYNLHVCYWKIGDFENANIYFRETLRCFHMLKESQAGLKINLIMNLTDYSCEFERWEEVLDVLLMVETKMPIVNPDDHTYPWAELSHRMANVFYRLGDKRQAQTYYDKADKKYSFLNATHKHVLEFKFDYGMFLMYSNFCKEDQKRGISMLESLLAPLAENSYHHSLYLDVLSSIIWWKLKRNTSDFEKLKTQKFIDALNEAVGLFQKGKRKKKGPVAKRISLRWMNEVKFYRCVYSFQIGEKKESERLMYEVRKYLDKIKKESSKGAPYRLDLIDSYIFAGKVAKWTRENFKINQY